MGFPLVFPTPVKHNDRYMLRQIGSVTICLGLTWLSWGQAAQAADDPRAREIVDRVARLFVSQSSIATVEMQITREDYQRKISMQFWSLGESNILIRISSPQKDAGTAILKVGSKIWYYLPKANRTVKMSSSMMMSSWMGSHCTLDDLVKERSLTDDYLIATRPARHCEGPSPRRARRARDHQILLWR